MAQNIKTQTEKYLGREIKDWNAAKEAKNWIEREVERLGASDERATKIGYLVTLMQWFEDEDRKEAERAAAQRRADTIAEYQSELNRAGDDKCDALMVWEDGQGYRHRRNYRTRAGLLRNCIKVVREGGYIELAG